MLAPYSLLRTAGPETEAAAPPPRWLAMAVALGLGGATAVACAALAGGPAPPAALHASPLAGWRPLTVPGLARPAPAAPAAPAPAVQRSAAAQRPPVALRAGGRQAVTPAESLASFGLLLFGAFAAWAAALATFAAWRRSADRVGEWRALAMAEARAESPVEGRVAGTLDAGNCVQSTLALLRLGLADVELRWRKSRDPTLALYTLPERRVITGEPGIAVVASRLPAKYQALFQGWYAMYKVEAIRGGATEEEILAFFNRVVDRLILLNKEPYVFESVHRMIRQPFDYFKFGQDYTRYLIDWDRSYLRNLERWDDIAQAMKRGENAILLGNHQTEADAAFIPLLLESYNRNLGEMAGFLRTADVGPGPVPAAVPQVRLRHQPQRAADHAAPHRGAEAPRAGAAGEGGGRPAALLPAQDGTAPDLQLHRGAALGPAVHQAAEDAERDAVPLRRPPQRDSPAPDPLAAQPSPAYPSPSSASCCPLPSAAASPPLPATH